MLEPTPFFFFGTLMDPEVLRLVVGRTIPKRNIKGAEIDDYRRVFVQGRDFPILTPSLKSSVAGILVENLEQRDIARIDEFEDNGYCRTRCDIKMGDGTARNAWVYLATQSLIASEQEWIFEDWLRDYRSSFLARVRRRMT